MGEDRPEREGELLLLAVEDVRPGDVRREKIGSELNALEVEPKDLA